MALNQQLNKILVVLVAIVPYVWFTAPEVFRDMASHLIYGWLQL
jgi:hypothetical protein